MRFVIFLAGAAMAASYMVTWMEPPLPIPELSPHSVIGDDLTRIVQEGPWQAWVFLGGFALAALSAVVALMGRASGLLSLLAGASPVALGVYYYTRADDLRSDLGIPFQIDPADLGQAYELVGEFLRAGTYMYFGGAVLLLLAGIVLSFGSR